MRGTFFSLLPFLLPNPFRQLTALAANFLIFPAKCEAARIAEIGNVRSHIHYGCFVVILVAFLKFVINTPEAEVVENIKAAT